jgi:adenosylcobinamide kinase / adenosylcobinamide-phosphate guanylyltransferase
MMATSTSSRIVLVTGPAKSGKSEWAETLAMQSEKTVIYIATAQTDPSDSEWQQRISQHRDRRPVDWLTVEAPENLVEAIVKTPSSCCLLVDSLGTWVANLLEQDSITWAATEQNLILSLEQLENKDAIVVAEETSWGVVPAYPSGRLFRDRLGHLIRCLGAIAHPVYLVAGGHVLNLSLLGSPLPTPFNRKR